MNNKKILIILGNQLFPIEKIKKVDFTYIFMKEDIGLCTYVKHHKQKILLFLSSMRSFADELKSNKFEFEVFGFGFYTISNS